MEKQTILKTTAAGLCTGCGICAGVCPKSCIGWELREGICQPRIDEAACVSCGLCAKLCPGLGHPYEDQGDPVQTVTGPVLACCNAWSRDAQIRHISASGGVVTTLVKTLLDSGRYDSVFCLDTYDYREQLRVRRHTADSFLSGDERGMTPKSRYLPVSHEEAVRYLLSHRQERIIFIATSCALRGLAAVMEQKKLDRENYLLIGLFCDKIFNHNAMAYWQDRFCDGKPLERLHFKNKESGGWPGDMKLFPEGEQSRYVSIDERGRVKKYFMPERCLYCVDKLNAMADISLGDNYTSIASSEKGSNSVILRTRRGLEAWETASGAIESVSIDISEIQKAQVLTYRLKNAFYGDLKTGGTPDLNPGIGRVPATEKDYRLLLRQLRAGACYDRDKKPLERQMRLDNKKPDPVLRFLCRGLRFLKRRVLGQ